MDRQSKIPYSLDDFSGGLNTKRSSFLLSPKEASEILNIEIDDTRQIKKRPGVERSPFTSALSDYCKGIFEYVASGTSIFLFAVKTFVAKNVSGTFTNIKTGLTTGLQTYFISFRDRCFFCNGTDAVQKYDGSNVYAAGCGVPDVSSMTATPSGSGAFSGTYRYKVTYLYDDYLSESEGSATYIEATALNDSHIALANIPTGEGDVKRRKIYRTNNGGAKEYFLLTTIADNTTTTYSDSTDDSALGTTKPPTDAGSPPVCQYMAVHKNRAIYAKTSSYGDAIYYSELLEPEIVKTTSYARCTTEDDDEITGIVVFQDNLYVFKKYSIWALLGEPASWTKRNISMKYGCEAPRSIVLTEYGIIFLATVNRKIDGIYIFDGTAFHCISGGIQPDVDDINDTYIANIAANWYQRKYKISWTTTSGGGSTNDYTYQAILIDDGWRWTKFDYGIGVFYNQGGDEYGASTDEKYVWKLNTGNADRTLAITSKWQSAYLDFGEPNVYKDYHEFIFDAYLPEGTLTITWKTDSGNIIKSKQVTTGAGADGQVRTQLSLPMGLVGKRFQVTFEDSGTTGAFYVQSFDIIFEPISRR